MHHNPSYLKHFPVAGITQPQYFSFNPWPSTPQTNAFTFYNPTNPLEKPYTITPNNNLLSQNLLGQNLLGQNLLGQNLLGQNLLSSFVPEQTKMYNKNGLNIRLCGSAVDVAKAEKMLDYVTAIGGLPK
jgi:hypothetical protein